MPNAIKLFDDRRSKWTNPDGTLTREAQIFIRDLWLRTGGATAPSNNDLAVAQFEDAGIAEQLGMILALGDAGRQLPPVVQVEQPADQAPPVVNQEQATVIETQVAHLTARLNELANIVAGLQQGSQP